ncbi:MAG: 5'-nucleotidase C-terminal domain-containing protein, partial [Myxococcaceae bacterium]|nr:5'-nucleotidase C-terminal domain-containing protein [Myxococcaceae bacterium]
ALGNHDLDYGAEELERCRAAISYPVLSANLVRENGTPFLQVDGKPYLVKEVNGVRLGLFAVAGPDFQRIVERAHLPAGTRWEEPREAARRVVHTLRAIEKMDAVVLIGHQLREDDEAVARAVPGIDLILGTHSHYRGGLSRISGTGTWFISPYQYLAYLAEVELRFEDRRLAGVTGQLVRMDASRPEDPLVAERVAALQAALEKKRAERFEVLAILPETLSDANVSTGEAALGNWVTGVLREAAGTHVFYLTASTFRAALPAGPVTVEAFRTALPYRNTLMTVELTGQQLHDWLALSLTKRGSDGFSQQTGLRFGVRDGRPVDVLVLRDAGNPGAGYAPLDLAATYRVGTVDFQARVAAGYRELFAAGRVQTQTALDVHTVLMQALREGRGFPQRGR